MPNSLFSTNFRINGVVDTNKSAMENINNLSTACGVWTTFDVNTGKWSVTINNVGSAAYTFNDSNILGAITISGTGLSEYYNRVEVGFPHKDLNDQRDYIGFEIPSGDLFPNEPENTLTMEFDCVNDPTQAGLLGARELKQSRVDKIIRFSTDFSKLGVKAGDLISVTNSPLGFTNKLFRVVTVSEVDADSGEIVLEITALEYDAGVYNTDGLIRTERSRLNGIKSRGVNEVLKTIDKNTDIKKISGQALFDSFIATQVIPNIYPAYLPISYGNVIAPETGYYKIKAIVSWGGVTLQDAPAAGIGKYVALQTYVNGTLVTGAWAGAGGSYTPSSQGDNNSNLYENVILEDYFYATKGATITYSAAYSTDYAGVYNIILCEAFYVMIPVRGLGS